ncbi:MAG: hypothetical protein MPJ50_14730 [Pirellulales bacterium]|nr:hypothetical protein [Pirellulales bacterium]
MSLSLRGCVSDEVSPAIPAGRYDSVVHRKQHSQAITLHVLLEYPFCLAIHNRFWHRINFVEYGRIVSLLENSVKHLARAANHVDVFRLNVTPLRRSRLKGLNTGKIQDVRYHSPREKVP